MPPRVKLPTLCLELLPGLQARSRADRHAIELPLIERALRAHLGLEEASPLSLHPRWLDSGRPTLAGEGSGPLDLSLSHDDHYCVVSVGPRPQGCDLALIHETTRKGWEDLLTADRAQLLDALQTGGDSQNVAGTRLWAVLESSRKASASPDLRVQLVSQWEGNALFSVAARAQRLDVLAVEVRLEDGRPRILAVVVGATASDSHSAPG